MNKQTQEKINKAAELIGNADSVLITAGAGMGVDSGLPDFRGNQGFWKAYPPYQKLGVNFITMASPQHFDKDPRFAWGFYGHRRNLYRETQPHDGFQILRKMVENKSHFIYTSNVDNHFTKAGFDPDVVNECHGSIEHSQCNEGCTLEVFDAEAKNFDIDMDTMRVVSDLPKCPRCGALARPNILMFGDWRWSGARAFHQSGRFREWAALQPSSKMVVIECGAGTDIPTVRMEGFKWSATAGVPLIRLNPRDYQEDTDKQIGIPLGALEGLTAIAKEMKIA